MLKWNNLFDIIPHLIPFLQGFVAVNPYKKLNQN